MWNTSLISQGFCWGPLSYLTAKAWEEEEYNPTGVCLRLSATEQPSLDTHV